MKIILITHGTNQSFHHTLNERDTFTENALTKDAAPVLEKVTFKSGLLIAFLAYKLFNMNSQ